MHQLYMRVIVPAFIALPIIAALFRVKYWKQPQRTIFVFLVACVIFNTVGSILSAQHKNNLPGLHLYTVVEFTLIGAFFYSIAENEKEKLGIRLLLDLFPLITIANTIRLNSIYVYNLIPRSTGAIIIIVLCINFLMKSLSFTAKKEPFFNFAVVVALLLYFSGSLTLFALSDFILDNKIVNLMIWDTHATFLMIMYIIFAVAYYKTGTEK